MPEAPKHAVTVTLSVRELFASDGLPLNVKLPFVAEKVTCNKPPPAPSSTIFAESINNGTDIPFSFLNAPINPSGISSSIS